MLVDQLVGHRSTIFSHLAQLITFLNKYIVAAKVTSTISAITEYAVAKVPHCQPTLEQVPPSRPKRSSLGYRLKPSEPTEA